MKKQIGKGAPVIFLAFLAVSSGCKDDIVLSDLQTLKPRAIKVGTEDRIEQALSKWKNKSLDPKPILIFAGITVPLKPEPHFCFATFDEDRDLLGLVIEENFTDANGVTTATVEEYPVFAHRPVTTVVEFCLLPIHLRDAGQRKDVQQWQDYVAGHAVDPARMRDVSYYRKTLPPIWISISKPNRADVHVYVYDRAGNRSEGIVLGEPGG